MSQMESTGPTPVGWLPAQPPRPVSRQAVRRKSRRSSVEDNISQVAATRRRRSGENTGLTTATTVFYNVLGVAGGEGEGSDRN